MKNDFCLTRVHYSSHTCDEDLQAEENQLTDDLFYS